jgi:AraC-like DNA-binding protein
LLLGQASSISSLGYLGLLGQNSSDVRCSLESAGQFFKLEPRTLARRLKQESIKFRELVDEARYDVARHLLADTSFGMVRVAAVLGYSKARAFSRAFHRWSGKSPTA